MSQRYEDIIGSYERAMQASVLLQRQYFDAVHDAIASRNEQQFMIVCAKAHISQQLANHLWNIINAAWESVYSGMSSIIW